MKKIGAYLLVIASGVTTIMAGIFILVAIHIDGIFPKLVIMGAALGVSKFVYQKCFGIFKQPSRKESKKYPLKTEQFPISELFVGDTVTLSDGNSYLYTGYFEGKYGFEGTQFIELTKDELYDKIISLRNNRITKWERAQNA